MLPFMLLLRCSNCGVRIQIYASRVTETVVCPCCPNFIIVEEQTAALRAAIDSVHAASEELHQVACDGAYAVVAPGRKLEWIQTEDGETIVKPGFYTDMPGSGDPSP
jgi:hypothetical protein